MRKVHIIYTSNKKIWLYKCYWRINQDFCHAVACSMSILILLLYADTSWSKFFPLLFLNFNNFNFLNFSKAFWMDSMLLLFKFKLFIWNSWLMPSTLSSWILFPYKLTDVAFLKIKADTTEILLFSALNNSS